MRWEGKVEVHICRRNSRGSEGKRWNACAIGIEGVQYRLLASYAALRKYNRVLSDFWQTWRLVHPLHAKQSRLML